MMETDKEYEIKKYFIKENNVFNECLRLFYQLSPAERIKIMDRACKNCGNIIENWVCDKCDNPL